MSPYAEGKRHTKIMAASAVAIMWGMPLALGAIGLAFDQYAWAQFTLLFGWVAFAGIRSLVITCPDCGRSLFMRGWLMSMPWPARHCGKCGRDLTIDTDVG